MKLRWKVWAGFTAIAACSVVSCFAGPIGPPDANCNPGVDPPSSGGCIWYNFYALTDDTIQGGSSFTNYYVAATDPDWSITTAVTTDFRVLDGGHQGDTFSVYDNGVLLGTTSATSVDANHSCANDPTGPGTDPAACWNDMLMSRGTFVLPAGSHSLTVTWDQRVPGGDSTLQWFEISDVGASVPETGNLLMVISGFVVMGFAAVRRNFLNKA